MLSQPYSLFWLGQVSCQWPHAMRNHVLRLFVFIQFSYFGLIICFIVMLHFIVLLVPIYFSFCVRFISHDLVLCTFSLQKPVYSRKEESNSRNLCTLNFILSQYSLQLGFALARFFHRLPHLWLSTVLLKVHHYISLRIPHFASHFTFICFSSQPRVTLRITSLFITSLPLHFGSLRFCHFITYTHTHSLSLIFPLVFCIILF